MVRFVRGHLLCSGLASMSTLAVAVNVTVSGQSAGGSMAMQHLFVFSESVRGALIAAGSPYGCGAFERGHEGHGGTCFYGGTDIEKTIAYIHDRFQKGLIDDPVNLKTTPVVVFNGLLDWAVWTRCSRDVVKQLQEFVQPDRVESNFGTLASHVWSLDHGACFCGECSLNLWSPDMCCNVNNCRLDLTGDALTRAYGTLKPRTEARRALSWVPQEPYVPAQSSSWTDARMSKWAILYVPSNCRQNPLACRVHVNYHGCIANKWSERRLWVSNLDLNEYGEANDIIVLYPQARGDRATGKGCWNWGFPSDDEQFDTRQSAQLRTVSNMLSDLANIVKSAIELPLGSGPPAESGSLDPEAIAVV